MFFEDQSIMHQTSVLTHLNKNELTESKNNSIVGKVNFLLWNSHWPDNLRGEALFIVCCTLNRVP